VDSHYDRSVLALVMLVVVGIVWVRRRWTRRREANEASTRAHAEAEALLHEQEIIEDLEARFHQ
jgi:hypothetical protein